LVDLVETYLKYSGSRIAGLLQDFCTHTFSIVLVVILSRSTVWFTLINQKLTPKNAFLVTHVK